ncbi:hypothetical protein QI297_00670 [Staphylococcus saprophyticus]|nr:hypothetical protein [Staphylococcus saprophyticus]
MSWLESLADGLLVTMQSNVIDKPTHQLRWVILRIKKQGKHISAYP